jgi:hypothetical protein
MLGSPPGLMRSGSRGGTSWEMGMLNELCEGAGLATESEEPSLCVNGWLL